MSRRAKFQIQQLAAFQDEFRELLITCLEQCSRRRWGLFGAYDFVEEARVWCKWTEADRLRELAPSIQTILSQSGERDKLCEDFLSLCASHDANKLGEPKLAQAFLDRIRSGEYGIVSVHDTSADSRS